MSAVSSRLDMAMGGGSKSFVWIASRVYVSFFFFFFFFFFFLLRPRAKKKKQAEGKMSSTRGTRTHLLLYYFPNDAS
jgi:predicted PurR-regulated permease PerM